MSDSAGQVRIELVLNSNSYSAAIKEAQGQLDKFAGKAKTAGHGTVSSMQAASASIRLLENPLGNNVRAIERLVSQSKVLSGAMKAAFPVVGAIAIGSILVKAGKEIADFIKKVEDMPKAITKGFASLNLAGQMGNDELQLANDKLQNAINKLQGKPQNNAKIAFDEARLAADKLATSIEADNEKLNELLSKNHLTGFAMLLGKRGTADREGTVKAFAEQQDQMGLAYQQAVANKDQPGAAKALKDLQDSRDAELRNVLADRDQQKLAQGAGAGDGSANMAIDTGVATNILQMKNKQTEDLRNADLTAQKERLEAAKAAEEAAKAAAKKRLEAMVAELEVDKLQGTMSLKAVFDFWAARKSAFVTGSEAYNEVVAKQTQVAVEAAQKAHEAFAKYAAEAKRSSAEDGITGPEIINRYAQESQKNAMKAGTEAAQGGLDSNALSIEKAKNDAREREAVLTEAAGKSMTRYAAAVQLAAVHAKEFQTVMANLQSDLSIKQDQARLDPANKEKAKAAEEAQAAVDTAQAQHQVQLAADDQKVNPEASSAAVGAIDALDAFATAAQNSAKQITEFIDKAINGTNQNIVKALFGQKTDFRGEGLNLAKEGTGTLLNKAEGSALSLFSGGKIGGKLGTKGAPMYVKDVDKPAVPGAAGGVIGKATGGSGGIMGMLNDSNFMSSLGGGKLFGAGGIFQGGFAAGGDVVPNQMMLVGENGPELMVPKSHATIIPNHKLGGTTHVTHTTHNHHYDARGATDPAATEATMRRVVAQSAPHIVGASTQVQHQRAMRTPQRS
jgi:Lambda phage tail tape-measure protein (Tape_meas_lam_C)